MSMKSLFLMIPTLIWGQSPVLPVLRGTLPDIDERVVAETRVIDLAPFFGTEAIINEAVRLTATYDQDGETVASEFDFLLFDQATPITRANFLGYVDRGDYEETFIHRLVPGFVIQGGGFRFQEEEGTVSFPGVVTQEPIVNEFGISNTVGTISMAKMGGNPDSATSQWFVSLGANSDNLDNQNGGFTVFGRISRGTLENALLFNGPSFFAANIGGGAFSAVPLEAGTTADTLNEEDFYIFDSAERIALPSGQAGTDETLVYGFGDDPARGVVASVNESDLTLSYDRRKGGAVNIVASVTDSVGNEVIDTFTVNFFTSYEEWQLVNFSAEEISSGVSDPLFVLGDDGVTNLERYFYGIEALSTPAFHPVSVTAPPNSNVVQLRFPRGRNLSGVDYSVEQSRDLIDWEPFATQESVAVVTGDLEQVVATGNLDRENVSENFYRLVIRLDEE